MLKGVTSGGGGITPGTTVITGGTNTRVLFDDNGVVGESAGFVYVKATGQATATLLVATTSVTAPLLQAGATGGTIALSTTAGQGPTIAAGTATTDVAALSITRTNNNAAVATGVKWTFTDTTSAAGFLPLQILGGAAGTTNLLSVDKVGALGVGASAQLVSFSATSGANGLAILSNTGTALGQTHALESSWGTSTTDASGVYFQINGNQGNFGIGSARMVGWSSLASGTGTTLLSNIDMGLSRGGTNQIVFNGSTTAGGGTLTSRAEINKQVTAIADGVATATFTVTIPNAAHSAGIKFILTGAAGAGGAIGAGEFSALIEYDCVVARTAGVNAVATLSTGLLTAITASVAGAATPTITAALSAIAGAVGVTNTFTLNVTITAGSGSSTNHTCLCYAQLMNANATGITIS